MEQPFLVTKVYDTDGVLQCVKCLLDGSRLDNLGLIVWFLVGESNCVLQSAEAGSGAQ